MEYVVQNQYGVVTVQEGDKMGKAKEIRFIDPQYKELFKIPDGGQILISYADRTRKAIVCKYLDDYHVLVGKRAFHICEFAERINTIGAHVVPFPEKRIVWQNIDLNLKDWVVDLREEYPDLDRDGLTQKMYEVNADYLEDERANLSIRCGSEIVVLGDIGRWNGRVQGYKIIESGKISDCLYTDCDMAEWYIDREGEFRGREIHHDGTNYMWYRKFKQGVSWEDREIFLVKLYDGKATWEDIDCTTEKLGIAVAEIYGWEFPTESKERISAHDAR